MRFEEIFDHVCVKEIIIDKYPHIVEECFTAGSSGKFKQATEQFKEEPMIKKL